MKRLHHKVNIVPIVAKADALTNSEMRDLKDRVRLTTMIATVAVLLNPWVLPFQILEDLDRHKIDTYHLPDCDSDEDDEFKKQDSDIKVRPDCINLSSLFFENILILEQLLNI